MGLLAVHFYPIILAVVSSATLIITSIVAILNGHAQAQDWPYVTDFAARPPESSIFSMFISACSLIAAIVVYVKYKQVRAHYRVHWVSIHVNRLNKAGLYIGWVMCVMFTIMACFPVGSEPDVHYIAAFSAFGLGIIYFIIQVVASRNLIGISHGKRTFIFRIFLVFLATYAVAVTGTCGRLALLDKNDMPWNIAKKISAPNKFFHIITSIHAWIMVLAFDLYFISFINEFKQVTIDYPNIVLRLNHDLEHERGGEYGSLEEDDDLFNERQ